MEKAQTVKPGYRNCDPKHTVAQLQKQSSYPEKQHQSIKDPHVEQEQTVSIKVQKDPQLSLLRISSVGRRRSVAFHLCEGIVLETLSRVMFKVERKVRG